MVYSIFFQLGPKGCFSLPGGVGIWEETGGILIYLFIYLFICLFIYLLFVYLFIYLLCFAYVNSVDT